MALPMDDDARLDILSRDLYVCLNHLENNFNEIEESDEKLIIQEWLLVILRNSHEDITAARIRNMALNQLMMNIQKNKLMYPFNERPSGRSYLELVTSLKASLNQNSSLDGDHAGDFVQNKDPKNRVLLLEDFAQLSSSDNRTYISFRTLPNNEGLFGYIAVTMGDADVQWLDCKGCPIDTPIPSNLVVEQARGDLQTLVPKQPDIEEVWNVLRNRCSLCSNDDPYTFYKMLYDIVEQEMLNIKYKKECTHPYINKLLEFLEADLKAIGVNDYKIYCRIKMLSILKKQIKFVLKQIEHRVATLNTAVKISMISPVVSLSSTCCYNFVTSALWNEMSKQRPGTRYLDILTYEYPQYFFSKYFLVLTQEKKNILIRYSEKYCKILDEMFSELENSIVQTMRKYKDTKWEWHLAHEIIDAYIREKNFKNSLCEVENTVDENTLAFFEVIFNEIEMAQNKLQTIVKKNDEIKEQLPALRIQVADRERVHKTMVNDYEDQMEKLKMEINNEKRDIMKREITINDLQKNLDELLK